MIRHPGRLACLAAGAAVVASVFQAGGAGATSPPTPAFVQGASTVGSSLTLPKAVTAGDLLVAGITTNDTGTDPVTGVSDPVNGAWTRATSLAYGNGHVDLYYLQNSKAGSLTVTLAGSAGGALTVAEYSGIATSAALDQLSSATGSGSGLKAGPTATIGGSGELVVGVGGQSNVGSGLTAGSGFTLRESAVSNWWAVNGLEDSLSTSSSGQSMAMTSGSAQYFGAVVAVFKAGGTATGPTAALSLSPTATPVNHPVTASAAASTAGANPISTYTFTFGDGTTVGPQSSATATHSYAAGGLYTVSVTVTDSAGLSSTATAQESVGQPTAAVTVTPSSGSAPLPVTANASGSTDPIAITGYTFSFGDGTTVGPQTAATATHTYSAAGTYTVSVTITDASGASSSATTSVSVQNGPTAALALTPASGQAPLPVTASATGSKAGSNPISTYTFSFGDGTTVGPQSSATATHTYSAAGTYTVTVTVTDSAGASSNATAQETVSMPAGSGPVYVQGASTVGSSLTLPRAVTAGDLLVAGITTSDTGTDPVTGVSDPVNGAWTRATSLAYGNGHVDLYYLQNSKAGSLTVTLAGSAGGALTVAEYSGIATSAALDQLSSATGSGSGLKAGPTATIGGSGELVVGVGGQSNVGSGLTAGSGFTLRESAVSNWWAVDGLEDSLSTSSSGQSMAMTSGSAQYFGAVVAVFKAGAVNAGPSAALTLTPAATPVSQLVTASAAGSAAGSHPISTYTFTFGDGTTVGPQSSASATHNYTAGGLYTVSVTVTDSAGLSSTATAQETVGQPSAALKVTPSSGTPPLPVTANASGSTDPIAITGYTFSFGDGTTVGPQTAATATHTYSAVGTYTVSVTITDASGASSVATTSVSVQNGPTAALALTPASGQAPLPVTASAAASKAGGNPISTYTFSFGDGTTVGPQSSATASHTYTTGGVYTVTVTVVDSGGLSSSATAQETVGQPTASLTAAQVKGGARLSVTANASASTDPIPITGYTFSFGDGTTLGPQAGATATHQYATAGAYTVSVTVTDGSGASATAHTSVTIVQGPTAALTLTPASGQAPLPVTASAAGSTAGANPITGYTFSFGDGSASVSGSSATAAHTYTAAGTYAVSVTVTDSDGLTSLATSSAVVSSSFVVQDTFQRANQTGWGTASGGGVWAQSAGTASTTSIAADEGTITNTASGSDYELLGTATASGANGLVRFSVGAANDTAGIVLDDQSAGNLDLARFGGSGNLEFMVDTGGTWTIVENLAVSVSVGTFYWLRFEVQGSNAYMKLWPDGTVEPASWTWSGTSSAGAAAGAMGLYGWSGPGAPVDFDSFSVAAVSGSSPPPNSTITGSVEDSVTDAPIAGVQVSTVPATTTATTTASGSYSIAVPAATYTVVFTGAPAGYNANFVAGVVAPASGSVTAGLEPLVAIPAGEAMDLFTQPNQTGGWSPSTDGNTWNSDLGTSNNGVVVSSSQVGITGDQAFVDTSESTGADFDNWMGYSYQNQVVSAQLKITSVVSDPVNAHGARLLARVQQLGANDDDTLVEMTVDPYNTSEPAYPNGDLSLWVAVNGTWTQLAIQAESISLNTLYNAQLEVVGSLVEGRIWPSGGTQPGWMIEGTQTALPGAGQAGTRTTGSYVDWGDFTQTPITQISGTVTASASGTPLSGATVTLSGGASTTTDAGGDYTFSGLTGGETYTVTVSDSGYTTESASLTPAAGTTGNASVALPSASGSCATGGLTTSTQIQSGVTNGPPNDQTETDYTYIDQSGNGWRVGTIPGYGGANIAMWYEVDACSVGPTQSSLDTTSPDDLAHDYTQSLSGNFVGSENSPYTQVALPPSIPAFRAAMQATVPSTGVDANGFVHTVTTYVYPGNPGFIVDRFDITNPSSSPILLSPTQPIQFWTISGLEQANSTWAAADGGYGTVGGSAVQGLPTAATPGSPDYFYIVPSSGSGVSDGVAAVLATQLSTLSLGNLQIQTMVNGNRLKVGVFGDNAVAGADYSFPAGTTITFYLLQAISRNLTAAQAESIAADYLNPDSPSMTTGAFDGFNREQGLYTFTASANTVTFTPTFSSTVPERWLDIYAIDGYTSSSMPAVSIGGVALTLGVQYLAAVDTVDHVAYVKLMEPLVPGTPGAGQIQSGSITIS